MSNQAFTRRASYGPTSPTIRSRGAKTRQQIVEAALLCFTKQGFHNTSVEDIATTAGVSRATLYQYFERKESIFVELMEETGGKLMGVSRRLGTLGPTAEGCDDLRWWVDEWARVYDHYATLFIEWANVTSPEGTLRPMLVQFINAHTKLFRDALTRADYTGDDPTTAAILVLALSNRYNYIRHVYRPALTDRQFVDSMATALQRYLFPETPLTLLEARSRVEVDRRSDPLHDDVSPLATMPPREAVERPQPRTSLSPITAQTVETLLDAAATVFAENGYSAANIDQIVTGAGVARGTFYRYFSTKLDIMVELAWQASAVMRPLLDEFGQFATAPDPVELRDWLARFLTVQRRYTGVLRAWSEGLPIDPVLLASAADVVAALGDAVGATFGPPRRYPLNRLAAAMMFASLLEHVPNEGQSTADEPSSERIVEAQAQFIERVILPDPEAGAS